MLKYLTNVVTLSLNSDLCIGCGMCIDVCPHEVFAMEDRKAVIVDRDLCMECGACAKNCPTQAISVRSGVGCAAGILASSVGIKSCCGENSSCGDGDCGA